MSCQSLAKFGLYTLENRPEKMPHRPKLDIGRVLNRQ